jgi:hypothetical protein
MMAARPLDTSMCHPLWLFASRFRLGTFRTPAASATRMIPSSQSRRAIWLVSQLQQTAIIIRTTELCLERRSLLPLIGHVGD